MKATERKTLDECIQLVRWFELRLNRMTQHSPYTIDKVVPIWSK